MRHLGSITYPIMVLLLAIVCLTFYPVLNTSSQIATTVKAEPSTVSAPIGEPFNVTLSLSNVENLYGIEVLLNWNPAVLRVENVEVHLGVETFSDGILHETSYSPSIFIAENNVTQTEGEYRLVATSMAPAFSFNGSGNIVRITFEPTDLGDSELDVESQLFDYPPADRDPRIALPIDHSTEDSFVTVETSALLSEPSTFNLEMEHIVIILSIAMIFLILVLLVLRRHSLLDPNSR